MCCDGSVTWWLDLFIQMSIWWKWWVVSYNWWKTHQMSEDGWKGGNDQNSTVFCFVPILKLLRVCIVPWAGYRLIYWVSSDLLSRENFVHSVRSGRGGDQDDSESASRRNEMSNLKIMWSLSRLDCIGKPVQSLSWMWAVLSHTWPIFLGCNLVGFVVCIRILVMWM